MRRLWYLARRLLHALYAVLHFFGKPGSRLMVPIAAAVAIALIWRAPLHQFLAALWRIFDPAPVNPLVLDAALMVAWIAFAFLYWLLSRALEVILGTFPMMARPLPPPRPLEAARRKKERRPAVVRVVVPSLPRRRAQPVVEPPAEQPKPPPTELRPAIIPAVVRLAVPPLPTQAKKIEARSAAE